MTTGNYSNVAGDASGSFTTPPSPFYSTDGWSGFSAVPTPSSAYTPPSVSRAAVQPAAQAYTPNSGLYSFDEPLGWDSAWTLNAEPSTRFYNLDSFGANIRSQDGSFMSGMDPFSGSSAPIPGAPGASVAEAAKDPGLWDVLQMGTTQYDLLKGGVMAGLALWLYNRNKSDEKELLEDKEEFLASESALERAARIAEIQERRKPAGPAVDSSGGPRRAQKVYA